MKIIKTLNIYFLIITIFLSSSVFALDQIRQEALTQIILGNLQRFHYLPKKINDQFSEDIYNTFLKALDPNKLFFQQEDIDELAIYKDQIDNELQKKSFTFYNLAISKFENRIKQINSFYTQILSKPFNFNKDEYLETKYEKLTYPQNEIEQIDRWRKKLKSQTLITYFHLTTTKNSTANETIAFDPKIEKQARQKVEKSTKLLLERYLDNENEFFNIFINTISNIYDPHTTYFPPEQKENFDISMTGTLEGIGAVLTEEDGFIKVVRIVPGSASWREKELEAEDKILKVAENKEDPIDIVGMRVQDAVKLIRGKKGTIVNLTVQKPDGRIKVISITRDVVIIEETYAKACIIKHKKYHKKFGYIQLPKFYRDFNNQDARNCTDDMIKDLKKMTEENISGLILDLRNNGGGSLRDAISIGGLFIKSGPIVQIKDRFNNVRVLTDPDPRIQYKGPLVVLINNFSASASEIVTAALQDYKRAIIIGSSSSFGKGTVQTLIDLDPMLKFQYHRLKPLGSLKFTTQLFLRINGESIQFKGVKPDIILPDAYMFTEIGEKKLPYSIQWSTVPPLEYDTYNLTKPEINFIKNQIKTSASNTKIFSIIKTYAKKLKEQKDKTNLSLNYKTIRQEQKILQKDSDMLKNISVTRNYIIVSCQEQNVSQNEVLQEWIKSIPKDIYIDTALTVLNDINKFQTKTRQN